MKQVINLYAVLSLAFMSLVLFWFANIWIFGSVGYYEQRIYILILETLLSIFMFLVSLYLSYKILFTDKQLILK